MRLIGDHPTDPQIRAQVPASTTILKTVKTIMRHLHPDKYMSFPGFDPARDSDLATLALDIAREKGNELVALYVCYDIQYPINTLTTWFRVSGTTRTRRTLA